MKTYILGLAILVSLASCDNGKNEVLQKRVDSLNYQLTASKEAERNLNEVGTLIDSIDASRNSLKIKMIEGSSYSDYVTRLREINDYVKQTENKLAELEKSNKNNKASAGSIRRLKADLEKRTAEILELELQIGKLRDENMALWSKNNEKDSLLSMRDQVIKLRDDDVASLEKLVNDTNADNKTTVANLYYAQAEALEKAANRTKFAPRKKKETRQEALELYRLSLSLGKEEAQSKISDLEKELS